MKAIIPTQPNDHAKNYHGQKDLLNRYVAIAKDKTGTWRELVDLRIYKSYSSDGASPVYASIWVRGDVQISGAGKASGYGYCKQSAAAQGAIDSAGIYLDAVIEGRGESAIRSAITAICEALGFTDFYIVE